MIFGFPDRRHAEGFRLSARLVHLRLGIPATLTDTFGPEHATTKYGFLYMAQGVGSTLGAPVAAMVFEKTGSWLPVFALVIGMDILTGLLALFVLKPMRRRQLAAV
jgi:MFS transporter, OFA family, oxalate/formate antiporter